MPKPKTPEGAPDATPTPPPVDPRPPLTLDEIHGVLRKRLQNLMHYLTRKESPPALPSEVERIAKEYAAMAVQLVYEDLRK